MALGSTVTLSPGLRHFEKGPIERYYNSVKVVTYPSGERRIGQKPSRELLQSAFDELGTQKTVAKAFGVSRSVVANWLRKYEMKVT